MSGQFRLNKDPSIEELAVRYFTTASPMTGMLIINQMDKRFGEKARNQALHSVRQTLVMVGAGPSKKHHSNQPIRGRSR